MSPALVCGFLTTGLPEKSLELIPRDSEEAAAFSKGNK